jgi:hypothetical protein
MPFMTYERRVVNESSGHEAVALHAYFKWLAADQPEGRDLEFWLAAEEEQKVRLNMESFVAAMSIG